MLSDYSNQRSAISNTPWIGENSKAQTYFPDSRLPTPHTQSTPELFEPNESTLLGNIDPTEGLRVVASSGDYLDLKLSDLEGEF
jgi:hypothetical protein